MAEFATLAWQSAIPRLRLDQGPGSPTGREVMQRRFKETGSRSARRPAISPFAVAAPPQMRGPVDIGERQRDRRDATGQPRQHRMECAIGPIRLARLPLVSVGSGIRTRLAWTTARRSSP